MEMRKIGLALFGVFLLLQVIAAQGTTLGTLSSALQDLCSGIKGLVPVAAMLMLVLAGVIYAAGQMMGAETRARANVWATACLTGALIGLLIVVIGPAVLGIIYGSTIAC